MAISYKTRLVTTTPYTIVNDDEVLFINTSTAASVILPLLSGSDSNGKAFYIKDYAGTSLTKPITIIAPGIKTIDGASFAMLNTGYSHIQIVYDGTNWKTI